jgi:tetratricopeptide (TPR) repeat protein
VNHWESASVSPLISDTRNPLNLDNKSMPYPAHPTQPQNLSLVCRKNQRVRNNLIKLESCLLLQFYHNRLHFPWGTLPGGFHHHRLNPAIYSADTDTEEKQLSREKMVTQLYTAPLKPYNSNNIGMNSPLGPKKKEMELSFNDQESQQGGGNMLSAMKEHSQKGIISIQAILGDFQSTMEALGVTPEVQQEIVPYLQVVAHQAHRPQPATPLIKQNLRAAADTMDNFISDTLGQKSNVVREWVDALLLQPVEFHSDKPISINNSGMQNPLGQANGSSHADNSDDMEPFPSVTVQGRTTTLNRQDQDFIRQTLQKAKAAMKANQPDTALGLYQRVLNKLQGADHPELEGRVLYQMGRTMDKAHKPHEAKTYYQQANDALLQTHQPKLQAKIQRALGNIHRNEGNMDRAVEHYKESLALFSSASDEAGQVPVLNQLGILYYQQGQTREAKRTFQQSLEKAKTSHPKMVSDILSNLGGLSRSEGKKGKAFSYYKQSLMAAREQNNREGVRQTLQDIAALYLDAGKPDKALKALQNALHRV